jgi:hypothetical protein
VSFAAISTMQPMQGKSHRIMSENSRQFQIVTPSSMILLRFFSTLLVMPVTNIPIKPIAVASQARDDPKARDFHHLSAH